MSDPRATNCTCTMGPDCAGPEEDCEVHGQYRGVLIQQRDEARAALDRVEAVLPALCDCPAGVLREDDQHAEECRSQSVREALRGSPDD